MSNEYINDGGGVYDSGSFHSDTGGTSTPGHGYTPGDNAQRWEARPKTGYAGQPIETPQEMLQRIYDRANGVDTPPGGENDQEGDRQQQQRQQQTDSQREDGFQQGDEEQPVIFDDHHETELRQIGSTVPASDIYMGLDYLSKGEELPGNVVETIATHMRMTPEAATEKIGTLRGQFESQAIQAVSRTGLDAIEVFDWARANMPQEYQRAVMQHVEGRTVGGYKGLVQEYVNNLDTTNPSAILNAEFGPGISASEQVDQLGHKKIVVKTPQGEVEWKTALRMGLINVTG